MRDLFKEERRKEKEKYELEFKRYNTDISILNKRVDQEEYLNKEMAILNNKLQSDLGPIKNAQASSPR
jgi:soluble cytochrome b562